jgi:A/G-specific adenine glycosylase
VQHQPKPGERQAFRRKLLAWYRREKRDLPWRRNTDPWRVLVSEIMLQQTTIATVTPRYIAFLEKYPTPQHLANAPEAEVQAAWSGLGYYSRARRLQQAAQVLTKRGEWPQTAVELEKLPGLGPYTSAAVASIAFDNVVPALDVNAYRVYARLAAWVESLELAKSKLALKELADRLIAPKHPGDFNQAIMELGGRHCTARNPVCEGCPVSSYCSAFQQNVVQQIPLKQKKEKTLFRTDHAFALLIDPPKGIMNETEVLLVQRPREGVYSGMTEFPTWREGEASKTKNSQATNASLSGAALQFLGDILHVSPRQLLADDQPIAEVHHTITRYKVTLQLWGIQLSKKGTARMQAAIKEQEGRDVLPTEYRLYQCSIPEAEERIAGTPQRKLLKKIIERMNQPELF